MENCKVFSVVESIDNNETYEDYIKVTRLVGIFGSQNEAVNFVCGKLYTECCNFSKEFNNRVYRTTVNGFDYRESNGVLIFWWDVFSDLTTRKITYTYSIKEETINEPNVSHDWLVFPH